MYIHPIPPGSFSTGDPITPEWMRRNEDYLQSALESARIRDNLRWTTTYDYSELTSVSAYSYQFRPYPPADRRIRPLRPVAVYIESITVSAYYTSPAPITLTLDTDDGPISADLPAREAALEDHRFARVTLQGARHSGFTGGITAVAPGGSTILRFYVTVGWRSTGTESGKGDPTMGVNGHTGTITMPPIDISEDTPLNAATWLARRDLGVEVATNLIQRRPFNWTYAEFHDITDGKGPQEGLYNIGSWDTNGMATGAYDAPETSPLIKGLVAWVWVSGASTEIEIRVADANGDTVGPIINVTINPAVGGFLVEDFGFTPFRIIGDESDPLDDHYIQFKVLTPLRAATAHVYLVYG